MTTVSLTSTSLNVSLSGVGPQGQSGTPLNPIAYNFLDFAGNVSGTDVTTIAQNFLLWCQLKALSLSTATHDNLLQRLFVTAYFPRGKWILTCPLIVPEFVNLKCDGEFIRSRNSGGNSTSKFYNGDTTSNANYNLFFPTIITVPRAHVEPVNILGNADGTNKGSGLFCGKNWTVASATPSAPGTGYSVNDLLTLAQPSKNYYVAAQLTVTSVNGSGGVTGVSVANASLNGYALPPVLQQQQWTAANGFTGAIANGTQGQVFDVNGAFICSGGGGTGASFAVAWTPDWSNGSTLYNAGAFLVTDTLIGSVSINGIGTSFDSTFGPMYGFWPSSGNYEINHVEVSGGGNIGLYIRGASDIRANSLNAVDCITNMVVFSMGSFECPNVVLDTSTGGQFFAIDQTDGAILKIHCLMPPATAGTLANGYIGSIGTSSSGGGVCANLDIEVNATNGGTMAGVPMLHLSNTKGSKIKAYASNYGLGGTTNLNVINAVATFGANWDTSNIIEGAADNIAGILFNGTIPNCGIRVWDDYIKGWCMNNSIYEIYGSGAPTNGTTGANKAAVNSLYIDTASSNRYKNTNTIASPTWTAA